MKNCSLSHVPSEHPRNSSIITKIPSFGKVGIIALLAYKLDLRNELRNNAVLGCYGN